MTDHWRCEIHTFVSPLASYVWVILTKPVKNISHISLQNGLRNLEVFMIVQLLQVLSTYPQYKENNILYHNFS